MLDDTGLQSILLAIADGAPGAAIEQLEQTELEASSRGELVAAVAGAESAVEAMRSLADALRGLHAHRDQINECHRAAYYAGDRWITDCRNPMFAHFLANKGRWAVDKWIHYFDIYDRQLSAFRGTPVRVLEIGVYHGGGLAMLASYLGPEAVLVGLDIDPAAAVSASPWPVMIGDQTDLEFLARVVDEWGPFDVIIDDGGHTTSQQIASIEFLFPHVRQGGVYIVEDTHTSYWPDYVDSSQTFIEWAFDRVHDLNAFHFRDGSLDAWTKTVGSLAFYDSVVVLGKDERAYPFSEVAGGREHLRRSRSQESALIQSRVERDSVNRELNAVNHELSSTNEQLNKVNEQLNTANVELNRTNEQLNTANVELNRTNEQLNTANVELNRTNEQLNTANVELNRANEQLADLANARGSRLSRFWPR